MYTSIITKLLFINIDRHRDCNLIPLSHCYVISSSRVLVLSSLVKK